MALSQGVTAALTVSFYITHGLTIGEVDQIFNTFNG
jgi:hypothetical protein